MTSAIYTSDHKKQICNHLFFKAIGLMFYSFVAVSPAILSTNFY